MPEDYYSDGPEAGGGDVQAPPEHQGEGEGQADESEHENEPTALLPKSILAGKEFKPGDEVVLRILAIHDDEVEVAYSYEDKDEGGDKAPAPEAAPQDEMAGMMD